MPIAWSFDLSSNWLEKIHERTRAIFSYLINIGGSIVDNRGCRIMFFGQGHLSLKNSFGDHCHHRHEHYDCFSPSPLSRQSTAAIGLGQFQPCNFDCSSADPVPTVDHRSRGVTSATRYTRHTASHLHFTDSHESHQNTWTFARPDTYKNAKSAFTDRRLCSIRIY